MKILCQPFDCSIFATVKNQYYSWLMKETVARGPENINLEMAVVSMANIFNSMEYVKCINYGFQKTDLNLFQSEPTTEVELIRGTNSQSSRTF